MNLSLAVSLSVLYALSASESVNELQSIFLSPYFHSRLFPLKSSTWSAFGILLIISSNPQAPLTYIHSGQKVLSHARSFVSHSHHKFPINLNFIATLLIYPTLSASINNSLTIMCLNRISYPNVCHLKISSQWLSCSTFSTYLCIETVINIFKHILYVLGRSLTFNEKICGSRKKREQLAWPTSTDVESSVFCLLPSPFPVISYGNLSSSGSQICSNLRTGPINWLTVSLIWLVKVCACAFFLCLRRFSLCSKHTSTVANNA